MLRILWMSGGWLSLGLGMVGVFLPLLPTVPFILLAAFCFARGSERMNRWLVEHPRFGPAIKDWRAHGAVSRAGKRAALIGCLLALSVALVLGLPAYAIGLQALAMSGALAFVLTRPDGPRGLQTGPQPTPAAPHADG
ncbi:MAG: YbaN family protein [Pseudomonadota bacterium]